MPLIQPELRSSVSDSGCLDAARKFVSVLMRNVADQAATLSLARETRRL
jgi:hypothetical protein